MKPKKINYEIEEPCHADWDQMKPEAKGRFCSECSKTVVDFSGMSDFSIVSFLENNKNQSVCGRFTAGQLDKTYVWMKPHPGLFSFDLKAVALGLALSTFSALPSQAQNVAMTEQHDSIFDPKHEIQGMVVVRETYDHGSESAVGGKVKLEGSDYGSVTISLIDGTSAELASVKPGKTGTFKVPLNWEKKPVAIRVTAPGYMPQTIYFSNHERLGNLTVDLRERRIIKGKVSSDSRY